ncbi:MAG: ABC transporter permease [Euryarchaeota archaeon]|nr:ABC transporter permease [Euryarchaeota archaeon]
MRLSDAARITATSIGTHKLRSLLAAIGVVLGIASVIGIVTLGAGIQESILGQITTQFDADLIAVSLSPRPNFNGPPQTATTIAFTDRDVDGVANLTGVLGVGATAPLSPAEVRLVNASVPGISVNVRRGITTSRFEYGTDIVDVHDAVVSNQTALRLMALTNRSDLRGVELVLNYPAEGGGFTSANVTIVGVLKAQTFGGGETLVVGSSFARLTPMNGTLTHGWQMLSIRAKEAAEVGALRERVKAFMETESDAKDLKGDRLAFQYLTQDEAAGFISTGVGQFTAFIGAIGAISLLVGLVGIANIMLVSVQERTREIGVMKATGASRGDVLLVFLVESVAICVVGAVAGILLGSLMGIGLGQLVQSFAPGSTALPFVFLPQWYAIAVLLGVGVGVVAGILPAWRAARVDPVEALRYE